MRDEWMEISLEDLEIQEVIKLGRGDVISKKDLEADPGPNPVYSSAENKNGMIGKYAKYMFDEELITWSVDGGGHIFHRPKHKFSVTNIGGWLRILDSKVFSYKFLAYALQMLHKQHHFDWQHKAHPSVIRKLYTKIPLPPLPEQKRIVDLISSVDSYIEALQQQLESAKRSRNAVLHELLTKGGDGWLDKSLGDVTECSWGNTETTKSKYIDSGYLAYSASGADGFLDWFDHEGTAVVLSAIGAQCGKTWFAEGKWTSIKNTIWLKSDNLNLLDKYLYYLSNRDQFWQIRGQAQPFISLGDVKKTKVFLPPISEQERIIEILESLDNVESQLELTLDKARNLRSGLLSDLLSGKHEIPTSYDKVMGAA